MTDEDRKLMREEIANSIRTTVNGKIDGIRDDLRKHNERHEADMVLVRDHMNKVQPYLEAAAGARIFGTILRWVAGIIGAWLVIKVFFTGTNLPSL